MQTKGVINVTVKTVPHPDPHQAIDVFARIIVKEILGQEQKEATAP